MRVLPAWLVPGGILLRLGLTVAEVDSVKALKELIDKLPGP